MSIWKRIHPNFEPEMLGLLPEIIDASFPGKATEQIDRNYQHGGGWSPMKGYRLDPDTAELHYPDEPILPPLAETEIRNELVYLYPYSILVVFDKETCRFEVARID